MTPQVPALPGMTPMGFRPSSQPVSSGGTIVHTKTGKVAEAEIKSKKD